MFRPLPMTRVFLLFLASEAQDAALSLARHGAFGPAQEADATLSEMTGAAYREVWLEAEARLNKIMAYCDGHAMAPLPEATFAPNLRELQGVNARLRELWQGCSGCYELEQRLQAERKRLDDLSETCARLQALDLDLSRLMRLAGRMDIRLGQLPAINVQRLRAALALAGYLLRPFDAAGDQVFVVVAGLRAGAGLGSLLAQAGWRELIIPAELQTRPETASRYLQSERQRLDALAASQCELKDGNWRRHGAWLAQARLLLALARPLAEAAEYSLRGHGQLVRFSGWVPRREVGRLTAALDARFRGRYLITTRPPAAAEAGHIPSLLRYPRWLKTPAALVRHFGVPRYGEFDPTLLLAVAYPLLFGAMFGDVGHGAALLLIALGLRRGLAWLRPLVLAAGATSVLFGIFYGSVFGSEAVITPLWQSPMHDPSRLLSLAVWLGVGFISLTLLINLYNRLSLGRWAAALLAGDGLAGLVFFLAATRALYGLFAGAGPGLGNGLTAAFALSLITAAKWTEVRAGLGERLLVSVVESLETAVSLFANTLSFLRVAAFSLNHVALALAVFTLADRLGGSGHWLALALGNAVIVGLEGGIVAIQALRLMYYEGFSRFFGGDGIEFSPLTLALGEPKT